MLKSSHGHAVALSWYRPRPNLADLRPQTTFRVSLETQLGTNGTFDPVRVTPAPLATSDIHKGL
jgi:hypothetical protein